jgi:hypothetical protein
MSSDCSNPEYTERNLFLNVSKRFAFDRASYSRGTFDSTAEERHTLPYSVLHYTRSELSNSMVHSSENKSLTLAVMRNPCSRTCCTDDTFVCLLLQRFFLCLLVFPFRPTLSMHL